MWAISAGERFEVEFIHSLNLSPVIDVFQWTGNELLLVESKFHTFGAGIPGTADYPGSELLHEGDHFRLIGIDIEMDRLPILTQEISNHRVSFGQREAFLVELVGSGQSVTIEVRRMSLATRTIAILRGD